MKRTSAMWYLVAVLLVLGGWVGAAAIAATAWQDLRQATVIPLEGSKKIAVGEHGIALFTDINQDREISCQGKPAAGLPIEDAPFTLSTDSGGRTWHLLQVTKGPTPGSYSVVCRPKDRGTDTASYGYAAMPDFRNATIGKGVGSMATFLAAIITAWTYWGRRTERKLLSYESS